MGTIRKNFLWVSVVLLWGLPYPAPAKETYYLLMFGSQRTPNDPAYSHSWATFVRAGWEGEGSWPKHQDLKALKGFYLEAKTISWLPANLVIRIGALEPEPGRNFDLHHTMRYALGNLERVSFWGAFQIRRELYLRAVRHIALLQSGKVLYKANDFGYESERVSNCIHAVSTVFEGNRVRVGTPAWGETASFVLLQRMLPWIIDSDRTHAQVGSALGLDQFPVIYRKWEDPLSTTFLGPINRAVGGEKNMRATFGPTAP